MRLWILTLGVILVGLATGASSAWLEFANVANQFEPHNQSPGATAALGSEKAGPKVVIVDGTDFDFGVGQRQGSMNHTFVIRNDGDEPLKLEKGTTTCKCTLSDLKTGDVPPGGTADVRLDWKLVTLGEQFRQTAEIHTNDPRRPTVSLTVHGTVTDLVRLEPRDVVLSNVPADDGASATVHLYGFKVKDLQVLSHEFTNHDTASYFSLDWKPMTPGELPEKQGATIGLTGTLAVKPGLPLGPINQTIQLKTNVTEVDKLELEISGSVVSDISIVGPSQFIEKHSVLMFGIIERAQGAKATLRILVKGPHRKDVDLWVKETDPADVLKAEPGDWQEINDGAIRMRPVEIKVRPGSRLVNRMGSEQAKFGTIIIETTHPSVKNIPIKVKFAVE
jgi:hypothetical protein